MTRKQQLAEAAGELEPLRSANKQLRTSLASAMETIELLEARVKEEGEGGRLGEGEDRAKLMGTAAVKRGLSCVARQQPNRREYPHRIQSAAVCILVNNPFALPMPSCCNTQGMPGWLLLLPRRRHWLSRTRWRWVVGDRQACEVLCCEEASKWQSCALFV